MEKPNGKKEGSRPKIKIWTRSIDEVWTKIYIQGV